MNSYYYSETIVPDAVKFAEVVFVLEPVGDVGLLLVDILKTALELEPVAVVLYFGVEPVESDPIEAVVLESFWVQVV